MTATDTRTFQDGLRYGYELAANCETAEQIRAEVDNWLPYAGRDDFTSGVLHALAHETRR